MTNNKQLTNAVAERAALGAMLAADHAYWDVQDKLRPEHFSDAFHGQIFVAIRDICETGKKLSMTAVRSKLPETYGDGKSTSSFLAVLHADAEGVRADDYVDDLVELWARRQLMQIAKDATTQANKPTVRIMDVLTEMEQRIAEVGGGASEISTLTLGTMVQRVLTNSARYHADPTARPGFDTGLPRLDEVVGPLRPGRLYFIGGGEKSGKTALATQILIRAAGGGPAFMAQGEMAEGEIATRALASKSGVAAEKIERGEWDAFEADQLADAAAKLPNDNFHFWRFGKSRMTPFRHRLIAEKRKRGITIAAVDHLLHLRPDKDHQNEFFGIGEVVRELKELALDLDIPIICMTHRTRSSQERNDPTPYATDFFGGGDIERSADALLCVYSIYRWLKIRRPDGRSEEAIAKWQKQMSDATGKVQVALLTHRHASFPHTIELAWNGPLTRFESL